MRRLGAVVVAALALAGSAGATSRPPFPGLHTIRFLPAIDLNRSTRTDASCHTRGRQSKNTAVTRTDRKLAPVACEQPPRSHVRDAGSVIILAP